MSPTPQENTALVRRFLSDVLVAGDTDAVDAFLAEDGVDHNLVFQRDRDERIGEVGRAVMASADVDVEIHGIVADQERVAVRASVTGVHSESLLDLAPTGERFEIACVWFCRVEAGRITEIWSLPDALGLLRQIGAITEANATSNEDTRQ